MPLIRRGCPVAAVVAAGVRSRQEPQFRGGRRCCNPPQAPVHAGDHNEQKQEISFVSLSPEEYD